MGIDCDTFIDAVHPRILRLVGDRDRGLRVRAAGVLLEAAALLQRRRRTASPARPALVLSVDPTGTWLDCDRCGLASWPVDTPDLGDAWVRHLAHCSGGAS